MQWLVVIAGLAWSVYVAYRSEVLGWYIGLVACVFVLAVFGPLFAIGAGVIVLCAVAAT